jgi:NADPH-dependent 2,4-dienoyl-CoA reductase/sulfur reductase-like enzyme
MPESRTLPVAVIGAGPIGPAAAHLASRREKLVVLEGGRAIGANMLAWRPPFLMLTGYEQVRSVMAALAGDLEAARRVELTLPETGVCSSSPAVERTADETSACCTPTCCSSTSAVAATALGLPRAR